MALRMATNQNDVEGLEVATLDSVQGCVEVTIVDYKVVLKIPFYDPYVIFELPRIIEIPDKTVASACVELISRSRVKVTVKVMGQSYEATYDV